MVQVNTSSKVKSIVLSVCILFSASLFAQSEKSAEKSTIVMTKSELNSFLTTVAEARRSQLKDRESRRVKQDLAELRLKEQHQPRMRSMESDNISNEQILRELRYLNQRIDNLNANNNSFPSKNRDNSTIIMPSSSNVNPGYATNGRTSTTVIPSNKKQIEALQSKIDSLKNAEFKNNTVGNRKAFSDSLSMMQNNLQNVRRQLADLETKMSNSKKNGKEDKVVAEKSYFKQQVYFENNSEQLQGSYLKYVQELTQILLQYPEAKVLLEGWASPLGEANYNKQLSMRRAESVETAFSNNNIDRSRILTSFRGEDKKSSAQHARRVDMSIIVR